jgi:hypothetical protein
MNKKANINEAYDKGMRMVKHPDIIKLNHVEPLLNYIRNFRKMFVDDNYRDSSGNFTLGYLFHESLREEFYKNFKKDKC